VQQLTRKLLHKKRKKVQILATPSQFFKNISQTTKARRLRFLAIDLAKNFAQNPSIRLFLEPPATIYAKSKTPKTASLSGGSLVKIPIL
jgi:glycerol-3-phosphate dehydrogenase